MTAVASKSKSNTKSPLRWGGGKSRLAAEILGRFPLHDAYVETCCGGAAVFWAKPRHWSVAEILNDRDGELINFYQVLQRSGRRLLKTVGEMPYSRLLLTRTVRSKPRTPFQKAVRFWYINRVSFGGRIVGATYGVATTRGASTLPQRVRDQLDTLIERLARVSFECLDVVRLVSLYDRPTTLFYVDPPYYDLRSDYAETFDQSDHQRLAESLRQARGTWLLSYNDHQEVRRLYKGCHFRPLVTRYTIGANAHGKASSTAKELLISNRPLRQVKHK